MNYIFLADGFEEVEALATVDILRRANIDIMTVGIEKDMVKGANGIIVKTDIIDKQIDVSKTKLVILPGGMPGALNLENSKIVQEAIDIAIKNNCVIGAICAAPFILGNRGELKDKNATCFPGFEKYLKGANVTGQSVVADGNIVTAKGMGVAIDFALKIVEILKGENVAKDLRQNIQWER